MCLIPKVKDLKHLDLVVTKHQGSEAPISETFGLQPNSNGLPPNSDGLLMANLIGS